MDIVLVPLLLLIKSVINILVIVILADVLLSWLITANVINIGNRFVYSLIETLSRVSNFMLDPIRSKIPSNFGAIDISPIILILGLTFLENIVTRILIRLSCA